MISVWASVELERTTDVFYEKECTSGDLVVKQWTIIYFIGYLLDGGSNAARSRGDWDFYEGASEGFASFEPHISDTISHPIFTGICCVKIKLSFDISFKKSEVPEW